MSLKPVISRKLSSSTKAVDEDVVEARDQPETLLVHQGGGTGFGDALTERGRGSRGDCPRRDRMFDVGFAVHSTSPCSGEDIITVLPMQYSGSVRLRLEIRHSVAWKCALPRIFQTIAQAVPSASSA